ncbi:hypothetical protein Tco_0840128 [Tanacetum coccineum]|uniref:Uncharacterized protein n=1 Tax=Tanacetum coccineum TaxID=301880 RepID=A0ABQ5ATT9_9ASTR
MAKLQRQVDVHQDGLCSPNKCYGLMDAKKKIDLDNPLCLTESKIMENILQKHPLRFSIAAASSVPWIYLGQIWHTLKEDGSKYKLKSPSNFKTTGLVQIWQTLGKMFARCLMCGFSLSNGTCINCTLETEILSTVAMCESPLNGGFVCFAIEIAGNSSAYDPIRISYNDSPNFSDYTHNPVRSRIFVSYLGYDAHCGRIDIEIKINELRKIFNEMSIEINKRKSFSNRGGDSKKEAEFAQDYFVLPIWSSYSSTVKRSTAKDAGGALETDIQEKEQKESQKQTNPSTG